MPPASDARPVTVLYVENGIGYGGAIICLRHLVRNLDRTRFRPIVVTGRDSEPYQGIAQEADWQPIADRVFESVPIRGRLAKARWPDLVPGLRWAIGQSVARADDIVNFVPFFVRLLLLAFRARPALIHANNEPLCNRAAVLVGKWLHIPVICHVRGDQSGSRMMRRIYSMPDHFITVSRWISESIGRLGIPEERRTVVYDGIELHQLNSNADGLAFRSAHGIPANAFAVGLVGLLIPWKGQRLLLAAAQSLLAEIPELCLVLVGGTPEECRAYATELRQEAQKPQYRGRVIFTGHVGEMSSAYNGLDVVLSASTSPEPLGTVVIESMALGRPLVAPRHGGAVEMIEHGRTGLLFEPGDPASLAATIGRLHREPGLGTRLGAAAKEKAFATFAVAVHVGAVQDVYERILAPRVRDDVNGVAT